MRQRRSPAAWIILLVTALWLVGCGADPSEDGGGTGPARVPDPCRGIDETGDCRAIAAADLTGGGDVAGIGLLTDGDDLLLRVAPADGTPVRQVPVPEADPATGGVAFHELNGRPGAEIVVDAGRAGATARFAVFTMEDGRLRPELPMAEASDEETGLWVFPGAGDRLRVMCRSEGGIALVAEQANAQATVLDYRYDADRPAEETRYSPGGPARAVPLEEVEAGTGGGDSAFFDCPDVRVADLPLTADGIPGMPIPGRCDPNRDLTEELRAAVASLPTDRYDGWDAALATLEPDPCRTLSAAVVPLVGTLSAPTAVLLFHRGDYVGPASECFAPMVTVAQTADDTVRATYRYARRGEPNVSASGQAEVEFRWQDGEVITSGGFPAELSRLVGCDV